jgi:hypothetical protein
MLPCVENIMHVKIHSVRTGDIVACSPTIPVLTLSVTLMLVSCHSDRVIFRNECKPSTFLLLEVTSVGSDHLSPAYHVSNIMHHR